MNKFLERVTSSTSLIEKVFLVFPPLPSKYRFLIHETVSQLFNGSFATISIGKEGNRRLVLYVRSICDQLKMSENCADKREAVPKEALPSDGCKKHKRPDKQLYIPPRSKNVKSNEVDGQQSPGKHDKPESPNKETNEPETPSWDLLYDDNGEVLDNDFVNDLNAELEIKAVTNQLALSKLDYTKFCDASSEGDDSNSECGKILEVYDISSDLKTRDLITSLAATK